MTQDNNPLIELVNCNNAVDKQTLEEKLEELFAELYEQPHFYIEIQNVNEGSYSTDITINVGVGL